MRTKYPVLVVMALATASLIWGMSGFGDVYGVNDPVGDDSQAADALQEESNESSASSGGTFEGSANTGTDSNNIVGLIISGISSIVSFGTMVALLPLELERLGFPRYFAYPIGVLAQTLVGIGIVQFATNRDFK